MNIQIGMSRLASKRLKKDEFEQIMADHKAWLQDRSTGKRADLSDIDFREDFMKGMDLSGMDFSYAIMYGACLMGADLTGANLSYALLHQAYLHNANLTGAIIEGTDFTNANLTMATLDECKGDGAHFNFAQIWDSSFINASLKKAGFLDAEVFDCDFTGADLERAGFIGTDLDNSIFINTNLQYANFGFAKRVFWSDFDNSDMTGVTTHGALLDIRRLPGVKGLHLPICCPEEGQFIAWKMCREGKIVKLLIPEDAERRGESPVDCRASKAVVLEIFDRDGNPADDAVSQIDKDVIYVKGETVFPRDVDEYSYGDIGGIYFVLSRAETERYKDREKNYDDEDAEDEEGEEDDKAAEIEEEEPK